MRNFRMEAFHARCCLGRAASDETKSAVKVDPAILATYAGKYLEQPRRGACSVPA